MFVKACTRIRETIYGVLAKSTLANGQINFTYGTGFMIAPGILATASHLVHVQNDITRPRQTSFEVIRAPEIGQPMENAQFIAEDTTKDIALLRIPNPRSNICVTLKRGIVPVGIRRGSLGFPLSNVIVTGPRPMFNLTQRFQGGSVSAFVRQVDNLGNEVSYYEADTLMYQGSSGCPCFLANANVFGMQIKSFLSNPVQPGGAAQNQNFLSISILTTSMDIINFARSNDIALPIRRLFF
jgi:S1-C subfamily serine protease